MSEIVFYNTRTRTKEKFVPLEPGKVGIYTCGPTVYGPAHIGNMRSQLVPDLGNSLDTAINVGVRLGVTGQTLKFG